MVKTAKCLGLPYALVFEDDAYPCSGIAEKLQARLDDIPDDA